MYETMNWGNTPIGTAIVVILAVVAVGIIIYAIATDDF
jgi:hypothetical protein